MRKFLAKMNIKLGTTVNSTLHALGWFLFLRNGQTEYSSQSQTFISANLSMKANFLRNCSCAVLCSV